MSRAFRIGSVLGFGLAGEGVRHWWQLRITSVALAVLGAWFVLALARLPDLGYASVAGWIGQPLTTVLLLLFITLTSWHSALGLQVVIEDYLRGRAARMTTLVLARLAHGLVGAAAALAVLWIALGGRP